MAMTTGTNTALTRSTTRWIGAFFACASSTSRTMRASTDSVPTAVVRTSSRPSPFTAPPVTASPGAFGTGSDSPVSRDSSPWLRPSTTTPSTGTRSPGRITTASPTATSRQRQFLFAPSRSTRAVAGRSACRARIASRGLALGARLQPLAQQDQGDDHGRGFEVQRRRVVAPTRTPAGGTRSGHRPRWCPAPPAGPCCRCAPAARRSRRGRSARPARTAPAWPAATAPSPAAASARPAASAASAAPAAATALPPAAHAAVPSACRRRRGLRRLLAHPVAGLHHRRAQRRHRRAGQQRAPARFGGQVHAGRQHARHLAQRLFHPAHAGRAGHALDRPGASRRRPRRSRRAPPPAPAAPAAGRARAPSPPRWPG